MKVTISGLTNLANDFGANELANAEKAAKRNLQAGTTVKVQQ